MKTEFMQLWDELSRTPGSRVLVIGATNRPQDLDSAIQRRFERSYLVGIPDLRARLEIFKAILRSTIVDDNFDYMNCAQRTENYSSSDIVSVCKVALRAPTKEYQLKRARFIKRERRLNRNKDSNDSKDSEEERRDGEQPVGVTSSRTSDIKMRPLLNSDVEEALKVVLPTQWTAQSYGEQPPVQSQSNNYNYRNQMDPGGVGLNPSAPSAGNNDWWSDINRNEEPEYDEDDEYSDEDDH